MGKRKKQRKEQRLRYRWPLRFSGDIAEKVYPGQMVDISSDGMAFICHTEENGLRPGRQITTQFSVPRFDSADSFESVSFDRLGHICRVDEISSVLRTVAIQFAEPLSFKPGEQDITEAEAQQRLEAARR